MPCSQVLTLSTLWKTLWKFTGFSQVFSQGKNSQGFAWVLTLWKMPCSQVLTFSTMWKTLKVHRFLRGFSQGLSQVFSEGKNSQGFAWVLTLWKMPCSQGLNSFTPCEKGVKNMWNWTVHRFFTAFSRFYAPKNIKSLKCRRNSKVCSVVSVVSSGELLLSQCFLTLNRKIGVEKLIRDAIHECHESKGIHLVLCSASVYVHCASSVVNVENSSEDLPLTVKAKKNCHTIIAKLFEENHFRLFVTLRIRFTSFTRLVEWRRW